ncbi:MAG TPA: S46 family peptidase, partial [Candidatus Onthomorpha intestinigallinarum]|nr:S46 family peptidase [Candidatus Onthomorpha intestinigallinarum]
LNVYNEAMQKSPAQRLRYASTVASIANGWKKWQGELKGLKRMNAIEKKKAFERDFNKWANLTEENRERYGGLLADFDKYYSQSIEAKKSYIYMNEALLASDAMLYALRLLTLADISTDESVPEEKVKENAENTYGYLMEYFSQDYENHKEVDRDIFVRTMTIFYNDFAKDRYVWLRKNVESGKYNNAEAYFTDVYNSSLLSNPKKAEKLLKKYKRKKAEELMEDPMVEILGAVLSKFRKVDMVELNGINEKLDSLYRVYVEGIMKMDTVKEFYPDANLTLRVAYGNVKSYKPRDGVEYMPYTTIEGIMEKENPQIYDYVVEERLKQLYNAKDYGVYANEKGELPVAFIASNHTTGGNSGSPVLDADGNLIGINFDRNWEGTMSDIMYDPDQCRNISLDIRYCLFIIDKFAGAKHLIDEMTIVK